MKNHEAGRESLMLKEILLGNKTVEVRLAKGKFLDFEVGDRIHLREDFYSNGEIVSSIPNRGISEIIKIEKYPSFQEMLKHVSLSIVLPKAKTIEEAIQELRRFYSEEDEAEFGVLAIHFKLVK